MNRSQRNGVPVGTIFPIFPIDIATGSALEIFDELFNAALGNKQKTRDLFKTRVEYPKTDIYLIPDKDELVFKMAVPGLEKDQLEIIYEDDSLCIRSGDSKEAANFNPHEKKFFLNELKHSSFIRKWSLPKEILALDEREIKSSLNNGILTIEVPLKEKEKPQIFKVEIE